MENAYTAHFDDLLNGSKPDKKQIAFYLAGEKLRRIDASIQKLFKINGYKNYSRTKLIEDAVDLYLNELEDYMRTKLNLNDQDFVKVSEPEEDHDSPYDTVVLASVNRYNNRLFHKDRISHNYPINEDCLNKIEFVAIYEKSPVSAITHIARFIDSKEDNDKYLCRFDDPFKLPNKIPLGKMPRNTFRYPVLVLRESLLNAKNACDLNMTWL